MARDVNKPSTKRSSRKEQLPFTKTNYQILGIALLVIAVGYVALAQKPWDGPLPLVVAPILLVIGYCILVPFGILYRSKKERNVTGASSENDSAPSNVAAS